MRAIVVGVLISVGFSVLGQDSLKTILIQQYLNPDLYLVQSKLRIDLEDRKVISEPFLTDTLTEAEVQRIRDIMEELTNVTRHPLGIREMLNLFDESELAASIIQLSRLNGDNRRIRKCLCKQTENLPLLRRAVLENSGIKGGTFREIEIEFVYSETTFELSSSSDYPFMFPWASADGVLYYNRNLPFLISELMSFGHFKLQPELTNDYDFSDKRRFEYQIYDWLLWQFCMKK